MGSALGVLGCRVDAWSGRVGYRSGIAAAAAGVAPAALT